MSGRFREPAKQSRFSFSLVPERLYSQLLFMMGREIFNSGGTRSSRAAKGFSPSQPQPAALRRFPTRLCALLNQFFGMLVGVCGVLVGLPAELVPGQMVSLAVGDSGGGVGVGGQGMKFCGSVMGALRHGISPGQSVLANSNSKYDRKSMTAQEPIDLRCIAQVEQRNWRRGERVILSREHAGLAASRKNAKGATPRILTLLDTLVKELP
jgi:hypothetical protein